MPGCQVKGGLTLLVPRDQLLLVVEGEQVHDIRGTPYAGQVQRAVPLHVLLSQQGLQQHFPRPEMFQKFLQL